MTKKKKKVFQVRVAPKLEGQIKEAAKKSEMNVSEWIRATLKWYCEERLGME